LQLCRWHYAPIYVHVYMRVCRFTWSNRQGPSTMSILTMSHAAQITFFQKMLHHHVQALWLEFFSRKPYIIVVAKQAASAFVISRFIHSFIHSKVFFFHILQLQLAYHCFHWIRLLLSTSVIRHFLRDFLSRRLNCRHRRCIVDGWAGNKPCISFTTLAYRKVRTISTCGWSIICNNVCGPD